MPTNPDLREKRQNQILDAAMQVFVEKGFQQARMDDIVEAANLSKGGVYWYFKSKEQIILAVLDRIFDQELNRMVSLRQGVESVTDRLRNFNEMTAKDIDQLLEFMPVLYEFFALGLRNPSVRELLAGMLRGYTELLVPLIQEGVENGELRQVDATQAALAIGAVVEGTILLKAYNPKIVDLPAQVRMGLDTVMLGLVK